MSILNNKTLVLVSVAALLAACEPPAKKTEPVKTDNRVKVPTKITLAKKENLLEKIKGDWVSAEDETGNVTFVVNESTVIYPDHDIDTQYKYKWKGDSINIEYNEEVLAFKVSFKGDTLALADQSGTTYYIRMKQ